MFKCLPPGKYDVFVADPPWSYRGRKQFGFAGDVGRCSGGAILHYETLSVEEICALRVADIAAKDCLLFLWATSPLLPDAMRVMGAWGFDYATVGFVWDKQKTNPGYYTLSQTELCLIGKRGKIPSPRGCRKQRQFVSERRTAHSAKPAEVMRRIEAMFPTQSKVELFARTQRAGWTSWGNEV